MMTEKTAPSRIQWLSLAARIGLGVVFVLASIDKIRYPEPFAQNIEGYDLLPLTLIPIAAIWLPWLELFCGVLLILGIWVRSGAVIVSVLLFIFIAALVTAIFRGLNISCGCFETGDSEAMVGWSRVLEDTILLILSFWLIKFPRSAWAAEKLD